MSEPVGVLKAPVVDRLVLVGVGLIGGSLARALRASGWAGSIEGAVRTHAELDEALALGVLDAGSTDPESVCPGADMVVLATDLAAMPELLPRIGACLAPHAVLTDVGSVKSAVVGMARASLGEQLPRFVPGHPIAGTERSGVAASFESLFFERRCVLTPLEETAPEAIERVTDMWQAAGATVHQMTPAAHDETFALTSHLPHLIAYSMVAQLADADAEVRAGSANAEGAVPGPLDFAAGGFADITRIAQSRADLWVDILDRNRDAVLTHGRRFTHDLSRLLDALERGDLSLLEAEFARAVDTRRTLERARPDSAA